MKIRKFEGVSEMEVMEKVKAELGADALILNIKKVQPRGIFAFFRKPLVEISAVYEERSEAADQSSADENSVKSFLEYFAKAGKESGSVLNPETDTEASSASEHEISPGIAGEAVLKNKDDFFKALRESIAEIIPGDGDAPEQKITRSVSEISFKNSLVNHFYKEMIEQGVLPEIAAGMFSGFEIVDENEKIDINLIVKIVYNTIIRILGEPDIIKCKPKAGDCPQVVALMGSTGVGKTTTIAKLTAELMIKHDARVSLVTSDTYRVAAVEQLKTYADILGIDVGVVYNTADMTLHVNSLKDRSDIIIIDTAGRSHKNAENMLELKDILSCVPDCKKYLTLSLTTKHEDLLSIISAYSSIGDFSIIFTKLDETLSYGAILNISYITGKKISYVTTGQNVPDDLLVLTPEIVAKALLGLEIGVGETC